MPWPCLKRVRVWQQPDQRQSDAASRHRFARQSRRGKLCGHLLCDRSIASAVFQLPEHESGCPCRAVAVPLTQVSIDGQSYFADHVVIATGGQPRWPGTPGEKLGIVRTRCRPCGCLPLSSFVLHPALFAIALRVCCARSSAWMPCVRAFFDSSQQRLSRLLRCCSMLMCLRANWQVSDGFFELKEHPGKKVAVVGAG